MKDTQKAQSVEVAAISIIKKEKGQPFPSEIECFKLGAQWQQSQSDLVSKEKVIELLEQDAKSYKQYGDHIELRTVEDCISKIKSL